MLLPSKTTLIALGATTLLWSGIWGASGLMAPAPQTLSALNVPQGTHESLGNLHQELATLQNRLALIEQKWQPDNSLSQQFSQMKETQRQIVQELQRFAEQHKALAATGKRQPARNKATTSAEVKPQTASTEQVSSEEEIERFEVAFWQESEDTTWSGAMASTIASALQELAVSDTVLDSIQCQQSACRIEFVHPEGSREEAFIETMHTSEPFTNEFYAESMVDSNGQRRTLVYVARPGQQLFPKHHP